MNATDRKVRLEAFANIEGKYRTIQDVLCRTGWDELKILMLDIPPEHQQKLIDKANLYREEYHKTRVA